MQHRLETDLANVLIAELAGDATSPQMRLSAPYERVEITDIPAPDLRQTRKRAATIPREARRDPADSFDAARTLRFSAPYARIEIDQLAPRAALVTGSFESAWFVAADDMPAEPVGAAEPESRWLWIVAGAMLAAFAVTVIALI